MTDGKKAGEKETRKSVCHNMTDKTCNSYTCNS